MAKLKTLIIVESPNKIKSIEKYVGSDYIVMASVGHIVRLPNSGKLRFGILDIENGEWEPNYKIDSKKEDIVKELKKALKKVDKVLIATDPDREGEAIADNLVKFLKISKRYERITFTEITKGAILEAIDNPGVLDDNLVKSQIARRILDRMIGYQLSGLMRKKVLNAPVSPSAGRVQSIALKLVIEKENERRLFDPYKYHTVDAIINDDVIAKLHIADNVNTNKNWIDPSLIEDIKLKFKGSLKVLDVKTSEQNERKVTPFKQAVLYRKANSVLGMSSQAITRAAQVLYEKGIISYPRTDSTRIAKTFLDAAREFITKTYGKKYVADEVIGKGGAQDAHEAIRPTNIYLLPDQAKKEFELQGPEFKVYRLIYNTTIQAIMTVPRKEIIRYELDEDGNKFRMSSSKVIFDGYYKAIGYEKSKELPKFEKGESIKVKEYDVQDKETTPPARYNDGSLIEKLDDIKVGRPSTFASTITILKNRAYVQQEGSSLVPTEYGEIIITKLLRNFPRIINEEYTSKIETHLDEIASGNRDYRNLLTNFWKSFQVDVEEATTTISLTRVLDVPAGKNCPICNSPLIVKHNKITSQRFFGCPRFPECTHTEKDPTEKRGRRFFGKKK